MEHIEDHIVLTTTISKQILINKTKLELNLEVLHLEDIRNLKKVVYIGKVQERHFSVNKNISTRQDVAKRHPLSRALENTLLAFTHPHIHNCKHIKFFGGGLV